MAQRHLHILMKVKVGFTFGGRSVWRVCVSGAARSTTLVPFRLLLSLSIHGRPLLRLALFEENSVSWCAG